MASRNIFMILSIRRKEIINRVWERIQYNNENNIYLSLGYTSYETAAKFGNNVHLL